MFSKFDEEVQKILVEAKKEMMLLKHQYIGSEHIFLSILKTDNSFSRLLKKYNIDYDNYKSKLIELVGLGNSDADFFLYTPLLKKILEEAMLLSREKGLDEVGILEIVMSSFELEEGIGIKILNSLGINEKILDEYYALNTSKNKDFNKKLLVYEFGIDLCEKAKLGEIDPVIGRSNEINRVIEVLSRKYKNNPLLIGPAGVGKTAIAEGLAAMIVNGKVPERLKNKKIIMVALSSLVANTKYRGEFEDRITKMLDELEENDDIILFIDEIHTIMGAGGAEGAIDAANIFKPALSRGKIKLIGATTLDEYKNTIEKDKAMVRRFQKIDICEPNKLETFEILVGLKDIYEKYHGVKISDDMLKKIIYLGNKYIHEKYEPDRSIDILDEVCAKVSLNSSKEEKKISELRKELDIIKDRKKTYLALNDYESAYVERSKERVLSNKILKLENFSNKKTINITINDIYEIISRKSGIPINSNIKKNISGLNKFLCDNIIGQNEAIKKIVNVTAKNRLIYRNNIKPESFLFIGPGGTGKNKLAALYGKYLFNNHIVRFEGSEYKDKESINKILGAPSGYVGYDDNKNKLEEIRNNPYSLVIFDEFEKASSDVINLFMEILDKGKITDNKGNVIYFDNVTIIMISDTSVDKNDLGFVEKKVDNKINLNEYLSNELINSVKNIIYFNNLKHDDIYSILKKEFKTLKNTIVDNNISLNINKKEIESLINKTNYLECGAKKVNSVLDEYIDSLLIKNFDM